MTLTQERKQEIISRFGASAQDTGNTRVQIALLTARINDLTEHLRTHRKDHRDAAEGLEIAQHLRDSEHDGRQR